MLVVLSQAVWGYFLLWGALKALVWFLERVGAGVDALNAKSPPVESKPPHPPVEWM